MAIYLDIWKKHVNCFLKHPEQICKSILEDIINDIPETSMYKPKVNDLNSDGMDELHNPASMYRKQDRLKSNISSGNSWVWAMF